MIIHRVEISGTRICELGESGTVIFDYPRLGLFEARTFAKTMESGRLWIESQRHPALRQETEAI